MKIRLMGPGDLVRAWAAELEREYSMHPSFYPMRGGDGLRAYLDMDDRKAAEILAKTAAVLHKSVSHFGGK